MGYRPLPSLRALMLLWIRQCRAALLSPTLFFIQLGRSRSGCQVPGPGSTHGMPAEAGGGGPRLGGWRPRVSEDYAQA